MPLVMEVLENNKYSPNWNINVMKGLLKLWPFIRQLSNKCQMRLEIRDSQKSLRFILWHFEYLYKKFNLEIHVGVEIYCICFWSLTCWWCWRKRQWIIKSSRIHPVETVNVCTNWIHSILWLKMSQSGLESGEPTNWHCFSLPHRLHG